MKWNQFKRLENCLQEGLDTYLTILSESSIEPDEMDLFEDEIRSKIGQEDYETVWTKGSDLSAYKSYHDYQYENIKDNNLFEGAIIVLKSEEKTLIIDGNHRKNTIQEHYPNLDVYVIIITVSKIIT